MDGMANGPRGAEGAANVGVIVANPKNGEILAMATDNPYDLNNPRDLTSYYSQDEINGMDNGTMLKNLYGIWKNYCISDAFEPGSTVKPLIHWCSIGCGCGAAIGYVCLRRLSDVWRNQNQMFYLSGSTWNGNPVRSDQAFL